MLELEHPNWSGLILRTRNWPDAAGNHSRFESPCSWNQTKLYISPSMSATSWSWYGSETGRYVVDPLSKTLPKYNNLNGKCAILSMCSNTTQFWAGPGPYKNTWKPKNQYSPALLFCAILSIRPCYNTNFLFCKAYLNIKEKSVKVVDLIYVWQSFSLVRKELECQYLECEFRCGQRL